MEGRTKTTKRKSWGQFLTQFLKMWSNWTGIYKDKDELKDLQQTQEFRLSSKSKPGLKDVEKIQ